jgi:hypothetical protein
MAPKFGFSALRKVAAKNRNAAPGLRRRRSNRGFGTYSVEETQLNGLSTYSVEETQLGMLAGLSAYSVEETQLGGWLDSIKDVAKSVIPSHTVVGKLVNGDASGAARDAAKFAQQNVGKVLPKPAAPPQPQPPYTGPAAAFVPQSTGGKVGLMIGGGLVLGLGALLLLRGRSAA